MRSVNTTKTYTRRLECPIYLQMLLYKIIEQNGASEAIQFSIHIPEWAAVVLL